MKMSKNRAKNELREIELLEKTRGDARYEPQVTLSSGKGLTYELVSSHSKEIDEERKRIHINTIKTNKELNGYYKNKKQTGSKKMTST